MILLIEIILLMVRFLILDGSIKLNFFESSFFLNFFSTISKPFLVNYKNISFWSKQERIMNSPFIKSFSIDAEPPKDTTEEIHDQGFLDILEYGYNNYPAEKEIKEAKQALEEFTDLINADEKKCGMIQGYRFCDKIDQDGDVSLFLKNIYSLPIKWDFTITKLYRTNRFQCVESDDEPPEFFIKSLSIFYGALIEGTKFTTSELSFYQNLTLEVNSKDDLIDKNYIFIGNFKNEFEDTKSIKEKQFCKDLDICRHFRCGKVFFTI
jgi:hypothetical protein